MKWLVCGMDDGVLRREDTRKAALEWWMSHAGTVQVASRYQYGSGSYGYVTAAYGDREDTCGGIYIGTEQGARYAGWDVEQAALYPWKNKPHERLEREEQSS